MSEAANKIRCLTEIFHLLIQAKTSKNGREYLRLGGGSYSSLGRVGKKENSVSTFGRFRLWTSLESSPELVKPP